MRCDDCREALSARLDDEPLPPGTSTGAVDAHVATCGACRAWVAAAIHVGRAVRLQPADEMPDLWPALRDHGRAGRDKGRVAARWALASVAVVQLLLAVPAAVLGQGDGLTTHLARDVGAFDLALAIGFLYAALRPIHAAGLVPFVAALVACHLVAAGIDVGLGRTEALHESAHVLEFAGLVLLWLAAHGTGARRRARPA